MRLAHLLDFKTSRVLLLMLGGAIGAALPAGAQEETCWTEGPSQFANSVQYCVSSVLAPQGKWDYGPKNLVGYYGSVGAWCEGVAGPGVGETITIRITGAPAFRRLVITNGYNKSRASFTKNGRVKRFRITSDTGIDTTVTLKDAMDAQVITLPMVAQHRWLKLKILEVYRGKTFADTCIDNIGPDFEYEEELLQRQQSQTP